MSGPNDPRPIKRDILVTKVVEDASLTTSAKTYTYNGIYTLLDAATTPFFAEMRVISVAVFGTATDAAISAVVFEDGASYLDHGVAGSRRSALHIRLPEAVRIAWTATSSTTSVIQVTPPAAGSVVQFTIEVRANASGDS